MPGFIASLCYRERNFAFEKGNTTIMPEFIACLRYRERNIAYEMGENG